MVGQLVENGKNSSIIEDSEAELARLIRQNKMPKGIPKLRQERLAKHWTQRHLAGLLGATLLTVNRWERRVTRPSPYFRQMLCGLFEKNEQELGLLEEEAQTEDGRISDWAIPPLSPHDLVGREMLVENIRKHLCSGGVTVAFNGLPGVGKTALALALAHDPVLREHFRDGILWTGLGPKPDLPAILSRWGKLLGTSSAQMASCTTREDWAWALRSAIGSRSLLLVIDDVWCVEDALTMKVGGPNCAHLITTRFPSIACALSTWWATPLHELNEQESLDLLRRLAPQVFAVAEPEEARWIEGRVRALVRSVGGLPLALTLAGNYLRQQAYSGQARRIRSALSQLSIAEERLHLSELRPPVESHPSLAETVPLSLHSIIAASEMRLSQAARGALHALAMSSPPHHFSETAALWLVRGAVSTLDELIDGGFLQIRGSGQYWMHPVIADYTLAAARAKRENASGDGADHLAAKQGGTRAYSLTGICTSSPCLSVTENSGIRQNVPGS